MATTYERDDERRLITVTMVEPYSVDQVFGAIERQAAENTWDYAILYDLRGVTVPTEADLEQIAERVKTIGAGRARGPLGIVIAAKPEQFRLGLRYSELTKDLVTVEVLLTA